MSTLNLTDQQVVELMKQLPTDRRHAILQELTLAASAPEQEPHLGGVAGTDERFRDLARQWKQATAYVSSVTEIVTHPAYQQIIGMGKAALPLILEELRREPDHWFWALQAITCENPVPPSDAGQVHRMTQAWLNWAAAHGY